MKIRIMYSGGKKNSKKKTDEKISENPQYSDKIIINLELSFLGERKNLYSSVNFLSTFEMLKEQLYHYIIKNDIYNINKFSYNNKIHEIIDLYSNKIINSDYLISYKNYIINHYDDFINKINEDELKEEYYLKSDLDIFFRDLKNKILNLESSNRNTNVSKAQEKKLKKGIMAKKLQKVKKAHVNFFNFNKYDITDENINKFKEISNFYDDQEKNKDMVKLKFKDFLKKNKVTDELIKKFKEISDFYYNPELENQAKEELAEEEKQKNIEKQLKKNVRSVSKESILESNDLQDKFNKFLLNFDNKLLNDEIFSYTNLVNDNLLNLKWQSSEDNNIFYDIKNENNLILEIKEGYDDKYIRVVFTIEDKLYKSESIKVVKNTSEKLDVYNLEIFLEIDESSNNEELTVEIGRSLKMNITSDKFNNYNNTISLLFYFYKFFYIDNDKNKLNYQNNYNSVYLNNEDNFKTYYNTNLNFRKYIRGAIEVIFEKNFAESISYNFFKYFDDYVSSGKQSVTNPIYKFRHTFLKSSGFENLKLIKENERLLMFVFILLLNDQNFEYILNLIYEKNKKSDQNFNQFKEILKNNLNFLYNDIFTPPEKNIIIEELDSFRLSDNDYFKKDNYFYDFNYITNIKNEFDFKIKDNLINYEINKFYFYINEIIKDKIILKNSDEEELIIYKDNKTKYDKTDKETSVSIENQEYEINSYDIKNYDELYSSIYNYKLNEVFEKPYNLPFFSNVNEDHFLIKFYKIESIPESLKPVSITQESEIDLNNFNKDNFYEIFFNKEQNDDRFDYLNDIIVYLYGKKYYLYIIFIIVKFLDFYENDFLNYINYLCEPNKYISLIILLKIYEKVKIILFDYENNPERTDILVFYEINEKKSFIEKEIEILKKKSFNINKLIEKLTVNLEKNEAELLEKYTNVRENINSKYEIAKKKFNDLDNFKDLNDNDNIEIYIELYKNFLKIENKFIVNNFFNNLINKLQNDTDYDNFFILYSDIFCNTKYSYIKFLVLSTVIKNNDNIKFNQILINLLFFSKEKIDLPVTIFNKNYSKLNVKKIDKISFLESGINIINKNINIEKYVLENLYLDRNDLRITENTPALIQLIKSYYNLKPNKKKLVDLIKKLKEKVEKEKKNIETYINNNKNNIEDSSFKTFIKNLDIITSDVEKFNDFYYIDINSTFLKTINKSIFKKSEILIKNDFLITIDNYKAETNSYNEFESIISEIIKLNNENIIDNANLKELNIRYYNYILNAYFLKYDIEGFEYITKLRNDNVSNSIENLIIYENNLYKININHILNFLKDEHGNINSEENILINYKSNLIKIVKEKDRFFIIYLEFNDNFTFYIQIIDKNIYQYKNYIIENGKKILQKYLLNDLNIDYNYSIINDNGIIYDNSIGDYIKYQENGDGSGDINFSNIKFSGNIKSNDSKEIILSGYFYNNYTLIKGKYTIKNLVFIDELYPIFNNLIEIDFNFIIDQDKVKQNIDFESIKINEMLSNYDLDKYSKETFREELENNLKIENIKYLDDYIDINFKSDDYEKTQWYNEFINLLKGNENTIDRNFTKKSRKFINKLNEEEINQIKSLFLDLKLKVEQNPDDTNDIFENINRILLRNKFFEEITFERYNKKAHKLKLDNEFKDRFLINDKNSIAFVIMQNAKQIKLELIYNILKFDLNTIEQNVNIFDCMNLFNVQIFKKTNENLNTFFSLDDKISYLNENYNFYNKNNIIKIDENSFNIYVYQKEMGRDDKYLTIEKEKNYMKIGVACTYESMDCYKNANINYKNPIDDYVILQLLIYFQRFSENIGYYDVKVISNDKFKEWRIGPDKNDIINYIKIKKNKQPKKELIATSIEKTYSSKGVLNKKIDKEFINDEEKSQWYNKFISLLNGNKIIIDQEFMIDSRRYLEKLNDNQINKIRSLFLKLEENKGDENNEVLVKIIFILKESKKFNDITDEYEYESDDDDQLSETSTHSTTKDQEQVRSASLGNDQTSFSQDKPTSANQERQQEPTFNDWLQAFDFLLSRIETQQLKPGNNEENLDFVQRWTFLINELNNFLTRDISDVNKNILRGMLSRLDNQSTLNYLKEFESFPPFHIEFGKLLYERGLLLPERGLQLGGRRKLRIMYNNI